MTDNLASIGQLLLDRSGTIEDPDSPQKRHMFHDQEQLRFCIDRLLQFAKDHEELADLPRRVGSALSALTGNLQIAEAAEAVQTLAENFENLLKLVALQKYSADPEALEGNAHHV